MPHLSVPDTYQYGQDNLAYPNVHPNAIPFLQQ